MPDKQTVERARKDAAEGKAPSTQAGEFVREEMDHIREGKHGARSTKQARAIGLSKARRAGVKLPPPKKGKSSLRPTGEPRAKMRRANNRRNDHHRPAGRRRRKRLFSAKVHKRRLPLLCRAKRKRVPEAAGRQIEALPRKKRPAPGGDQPRVEKINPVRVSFPGRPRAIPSIRKRSHLSSDVCHQRNQKEHQEQKEYDLGNAGRGQCDTSESENRRKQRYQEKCQGPI